MNDSEEKLSEKELSEVRESVSAFGRACHCYENRTDCGKLKEARIDEVSEGTTRVRSFDPAMIPCCSPPWTDTRTD